MYIPLVNYLGPVINYYCVGYPKNNINLFRLDTYFVGGRTGERGVFVQNDCGGYDFLFFFLSRQVRVYVIISLVDPVRRTILIIMLIPKLKITTDSVHVCDNSAVSVRIT